MRIIILFICLLLPFQPLRADVVLRLEFQIGDPLILGNIKNMDVRLFDTVTPSTVTNFLSYLDDSTVNGGNYNNSFMHRSVSNFILQGGSFTFDATIPGGFINDPDLNDFTGGLKKIITDDPIPNEFAKSNLRGTIAMAKIAAIFTDSNGDQCFIAGPDCFLVDGTGADSATSGWFINLSDNAGILDGQNGGFTVFGEVINGAMSVVDTMASTPMYDRRDIHLAFGSVNPPPESLPLVDCIPADCISGEIKDNNLIKMRGATKYFSITPDIDFGPIHTGTGTDVTVTIDNISSDVLDVSGISIDSGLSNPFEIIAGSNCIGTPIPLNGSCQFTVSFSPLVDGQFSDAVNINFSNISIDYALALQGLSAQVIEPEISPSEVLIDFGSVLVDPTNTFPNLHTIIITNEGVVDLNILSVSFDTQDVDDFHDFENCTVNTPIAPGKLCVLQFDFRPLSFGFKEASFTIVSNDSDEPEIVISAFGVGEEDNDGVPFDHENACLGSGDCNFDGIVDGIQNDVASIRMENGNYITLVTTANTQLKNVVTIAADTFQSTENLPEIDIGVLGFALNGFVAGENTELGLIIPAETTPKTVYMYGSTIDNIDPHWYEFMFDGATGTGAIIFDDVTSFNGVAVKKSTVTLFFVDGERGDSDMTKNGVISNGILTTDAKLISSGSGSGGMGLLFLLFISAYLLASDLLRKKISNRGRLC